MRRAVSVLACALGACELVAPLEDVRQSDVDASAGGTSGAIGGSSGAGGSVAGSGGQGGSGNSSGNAGSGGAAGGGGGASGNAGSAGSGGSSGAVPVLVASGQSGPEYPTLDATHVYWTNSGSVARAPKAGGAVETVVATGDQNEGLAVDASNVYFADRGAHTVSRAPKTGGNATILAQNQAFPQEVGVDAQWVYWTSEGDGAIRRVLKGGGSVETLASNQTAAYALAVDAGEVFWSLTTGEVRKLSLGACCTVTPLSAGVGSSVFSIAVDATHVYWVSQSGSSVQRVPRGGGASQEIGVVQLGVGMAVDDTYVYIGEDANPGSVRRRIKDGSGGDSLVTMQDHPRGVAVDAEAVYWANTDAGTVYKTLK